MMAPLTRAAVLAPARALSSLADPASPDALLALLRLLYAVGRRDLPAGRLLEGHLDALQIVTRYGTPDQAGRAVAAARAGRLFGVWNADRPGAPTVLDGERLSGGKAFASGAGLVTDALISVDAPDGRQLLLLDLDAAPPAIDRSWWRVTGMQRSETHLVAWADRPLPPDARIGVPGDYLTEPWFGGGAIRFAAVQAGGIAALEQFPPDVSRGGDSHGRADLIQDAGWMEAGMDGQAIVDGPAVASAGRS